jgi:Domain of unknown function (DUF4838)
MRGSRLAAVATLLASLTVAAACQLPVSIAAERSSRPSVVVAWWSAERTPVPSFAASELARYLNRMSGVSVGVRTGSFGPALPGRVAASLVVLTGRAAAAAAQDGPVRLDPAWAAGPIAGLGAAEADAFAIDVLRGDTAVMVAANQRGILYAAYDLLEQFGVRFYAPDLAAYRGNAESVPKRPLALPAYRTSQHAGLALRTLDLDEGWSISAAALGRLVDWMGKARMNVLAVPSDLDASSYDSWRALLTPIVAQRGIVLEVGQHGFGNWLPQTRYPQFYASGATVFDIANDQAVATYVGAVVAYLVARPEVGIFDAWPPDDATWAPATVKRFGSPSNAQAYLVGRLTAAVAARLPAVRVETIAYQATQEPPSPAYAYDTRRNVIDVAMGGRTYAAPISSAANARSAANLLRWRRAFGGDLGAYEYYRRYAFRSLPFPLADVVAGDLAWYGQVGVAGIRSYGEPGDWITYEVTHLAAAAFAWNPGQDPTALLAGYLHERYGGAADAVGRYLVAAEAASVAEFGSPAGPPTMLDAATTGYSAAAADLVDAAASAGPSSAAAFLIERLRWNADFALADARLTASVAAGDAVAALQAQAAGAALLRAHPLDGILVDNPRYAPQYGEWSRTSQEYARAYRSGFAFLEPAGVVTLSPGASVQVRVTASAHDLAAHGVTWSVSAGSGLTVTPGGGSLSVGAGSQGTAMVTLTAGRDLGRVRVALNVRSGSDTWSTTGLDVVIAGAGDLAPYRDSSAVSSDAALTNPTFDGHGCGYSQQALVAAGVVSGGPVSVDGLTVSWPATGGPADNIVARGQQVALPAGTRGSRLVLLASSTPADALGAGWVTYADASKSYYQVRVPDWRLTAGPASLGADTRVVAQSAYHTCGRPTTGVAYVFAVEVPVDRTRDVSSVTLPVAFGGSVLHVFGLSVG